jgi:hypothetical protein
VRVSSRQLITRGALAFGALLCLPGCPEPEIIPLPKGPPPEYEPPREYNPTTDIDGKNPTSDDDDLEGIDDPPPNPVPAPSASTPTPQPAEPAGSAPAKPEEE